tara:strand:- start:405 stop:983 length:579 start_codon:yes stop_codon:yes gene_type:complete
MNQTNKFISADYLNQSVFETKYNRKAYAFWLVGNSGSGKSTLAKEVEKKLFDANIKVKCLDGDNMRNTINSDLDLSIESRNENIRRSAEISKMFLETGISTLNCFISPLEIYREQAKKIIGNRFRLIYIKASNDEVKKRDVKGFYKNDADAMNKSLNMFVKPINPDLIIDTTNKSIKYSANILYNFVLNQPI